LGVYIPIYPRRYAPDSTNHGGYSRVIGRSAQLSRFNYPLFTIHAATVTIVLPRYRATVRTMVSPQFT